MAWPLRRYFRLLWWSLCLLTFMALPLTIWEFQKQHYDVHYQAWFIGGIFVILSMPISIYEIAMHTEYYTQPRLQKHVIRILLMVPIYAVDAWFALRFRKAREYLDPIRECYEAFVIYSFFAYLMAFLQGTYGNLDEHMSKKPQMHHMWGVQYLLRPWDMGTQFMWECKKGILNYVILRPLCTGLAFITAMFHMYDEGQINFNKSYVYLATVTNFSQLWALYCLVMVYTAMHDELAPLRPLSKFICIKAVVFVTFWQGVGIAILVYANVIRAESWYESQDVASGIQDFLICMEMFLAALAHAYAFPPRDYMAGHSKGFLSNVRYIFDLRDVVDDVGLVVEEHVSTATTAVVKVPQRAVKKAAQGLAKNTKKLFKVAGKSAGLTDEEEASKCALLGPASPPLASAGTGGAVGSGPSSSRNHSSGGAGPSGGCRSGSNGGGIERERRLSSGGGSGGGAGDTEALLASYGGGSGGNSARQPLAPPQQHFMMLDMEPAGLGNSLAATPGLRTTPLNHHMAPLPPSAAALGSSGGGGSAFNTLVTSALYHTRGGLYDQGGGGGGSGLARAHWRGNADPQLQQPLHAPAAAAAGSELSDFSTHTDSAAAAAASSNSGLELPLMSISSSSRSQGATTVTHSLGEGAGRGAGAGGVGGRPQGKKTEASVRPIRSGGGTTSAGAISSGNNSPLEQMPSDNIPAYRRAHEE